MSTHLMKELTNLQTAIPSNVTVHEFGSGAELRKKGFRLVMTTSGTLDEVLKEVCPGEGVEVAVTYGAQHHHVEHSLYEFYISVRFNSESKSQ